MRRFSLPAAAAASIGVLLGAGLAVAQNGGGTDDSGWDTTLARGEAWDLAFETSEGTWMSLDPTPYGGYPWLDEPMFRNDVRPIRPEPGSR